MEALSILVQKLWPMLKFFKESQTSGSMSLHQRSSFGMKCLVTRNTHLKRKKEDILLRPMTLYSYFMATRGTVKLLSRGSGEDLGNCCQRPKAEVNSFPDLLHYRGTMV